MKRRILRILICLLLGVGTTVAVAWVCVIRWHRQSPEARDKVQRIVRSDAGLIGGNQGKPYTWFTEVPGCYESLQSRSPRFSQDFLAVAHLRRRDRVVSQQKFSERLPAWSRLRVEEPVETMPMPEMDFAGRWSMFCEIGAGWPWLALRGVYVQLGGVDRSGELVRRFSMRSGIIEMPVKDWYGSDAIIVPFRPIWPGFIGSVVLYGSAWLMVLTMPGVLRRRLRRRRGRCPMCNYDLRGDLARGCSECGWNREP